MFSAWKHEIHQNSYSGLLKLLKFKLQAPKSIKIPVPGIKICSYSNSRYQNLSKCKLPALQSVHIPARALKFIQTHAPSIKIQKDPCPTHHNPFTIMLWAFQVNKPFYYTTPGSLDHLTARPIDSSTIQAFNHSTTQPLDCSTTQPRIHSTAEPLKHLTNQPLNRSTTQPLNRSTTQQLNHSTTRTHDF